MKKFSTWVKSVGGVANAAQVLDKPLGTIKAWLNLNRYPCIYSIQDIENKIGIDVISFDRWRGQYLRANGMYPKIEKDEQ